MLQRLRRQPIRYYKTVPMGFETLLYNKYISHSEYYKTVPMGFETRVSHRFDRLHDDYKTVPMGFETAFPQIGL